MRLTLRLRRTRTPNFPKIGTLALAAFACVATAFGADARLLSLLPAKAEGVAGVNVRAVLNSGLAAELMKPHADGERDGLAELSAMTGLDLKRDIDEAIFAGYNAPGASGSPKPSGNRGVGFITGTFNASQIGSAILSKGGGQQAYKSYTLYKPASGADKAGADKDKDDGVLTFLDGGTMVVGNAADVKQVLDNAQGQLPASIRNRAQEVSGRYDIWLVSAAPPARMANSLTGDDSEASNPAGALAGDFFKKVESTQGGIKFGPTVSVGLEVISTSPEDATALMNVLEFFKSMVSAQPAKEGQSGPPPGLAGMLNAVRMRTEAKTLFLTMEVPEADVIHFVRNARQRAPKPKTETSEEIVVIQ